MKLYVGNLSFNATETEIEDLFSPFGEVREVALITDKMSGQSRGFGFVTMATATEGEAAIASLHGKSVQGRDLTVNEARAREDRGSKSFAGSRR